MSINSSRYNLRQFLEIINQSIEIEKNIPMKEFSTFRCGGKADFFLRPRNFEEFGLIKRTATACDIPLFILGLGANILVSDKGIREPVVFTGLVDRILLVQKEGETSASVIEAEAGATMDELCDFAAENHLAGMEFLAGLPSSVGGAIYMNARCYDFSISDKLLSVKYLDERGDEKIWIPSLGDFSYKKSPFQSKQWIILSARFKIGQGDGRAILQEMATKRMDRESKGHYRFPCAGSVFKNNRLFGAPSGQLIESLELKGRQIGEAKIADYHGNIIINLGQAKSADILRLILLIQQEVEKRLHIHLEPEVLLVGEW